MEWVAGQITPEESVVAQRPQGPLSPNVIRESCGVPKSWNGGRGPPYGGEPPADTVGSGAFWLPVKGGARAPLEVPEVRMRA